MHLSHRLERGRSPVYCFGPGPYHLPGRQPNSACRSADHLFCLGAFCSIRAAVDLSPLLGKRRRTGLALWEEERKTVASVEISRDSQYVHIYIHIYSICIYVSHVDRGDLDFTDNSLTKAGGFPLVVAGTSVILKNQMATVLLLLLFSILDR